MRGNQKVGMSLVGEGHTRASHFPSHLEDHKSMVVRRSLYKVHLLALVSSFVTDLLQRSYFPFSIGQLPVPESDDVQHD